MLEGQNLRGGPGDISPQKFKQIDNGVRKTEQYTEEYSYQSAEIEPDYPSTDMDVDLRIDLQSSGTAHLEFKRLGHVDKEVLEDELYQNSNSIKNKYDDIATDIDTHNDDKISDITMESVESPDGISDEQWVRNTVAEITSDRDLKVNEIRVQIQNEAKFTISNL